MRMAAIIGQEIGAIPTHVTDGSVVIHLKSNIFSFPAW
jgi:hypothetical protein